MLLNILDFCVKHNDNLKFVYIICLFLIRLPICHIATRMCVIIVGLCNVFQGPHFMFSPAL